MNIAGIPLSEGGSRGKDRSGILRPTSTITAVLSPVEASSTASPLWFNPMISMIAVGIHPPRPFVPGISGRLALVREGGGKICVVAIGNYAVQRLLKPLHDWF